MASHPSYLVKGCPDRPALVVCAVIKKEVKRKILSYYTPLADPDR
jgi:hypothetical protein